MTVRWSYYTTVMTMPSFGQLALYGLTLAFPLAFVYHHLTAESKPAAKPAPAPQGEQTEKKPSIMQPERTDLDPPKNDPYTQEQLKAYDGSDPSKPVYVAIKGSFVAFHSTSSPPPPLFALSRSGAYAQHTCVNVMQERFSTCRGNARRMGPADHMRF